MTSSISLQNDESKSYRSRLPVTALPLSTKVEYSEQWKGHRLPLIAIQANGRLGNVMGEYATMYAIQKIYGIPVMQTVGCNKELKKAFPHLTLPVLQSSKKSNAIFLGRNKLDLVSIRRKSQYMSVREKFECALVEQDLHACFSQKKM